MSHCKDCGEYPQAPKPEPPILVDPEYHIFDKDVCFEDCTTGFIVYKLDINNNILTKIDVLDFEGNSTNKKIVKCPEYQVITEQVCSK